MSIFSSQQERNHFVSQFCSRPLEIPGIMALNKVGISNQSFYTILVGYRNECVEQGFISKAQLRLCENHLIMLANRCEIKHTKLNIEPQKLKTTEKTKTTESLTQRLFNKVFHKPHQKEAKTAACTTPEEKPVVIRSGAVWQLIETFCSDSLSLSEIYEWESHAEECSNMDVEESSPHVYYEQLIEIRDKYAKELTPQELTTFDGNLETLAQTCCIEHERY